MNTRQRWHMLTLPMNQSLARCELPLVPKPSLLMHRELLRHLSMCMINKAWGYMLSQGSSLDINQPVPICHMDELHLHTARQTMQPLKLDHDGLATDRNSKIQPQHLIWPRTRVAHG